MRRGVRQALEGFIELVEGGDAAQLPGRRVYVSFGRAEARRGRSIEVLLAAYRAGAQVAWRGFAEAGEVAGLPPGDLYTLAEALFAYIDELSAASAEGVAQEQTVAAREAHPGIGRIALESGVSVIPVAIHGSAGVRGWKKLRFPKVTVQFGEPLAFPVEQSPSRERQLEVAGEVFDRVRAMYTRLEEQGRRGVIRALRDCPAPDPGETSPKD